MEARAGNSILDFETLFSDFQELLNGSGLTLAITNKKEISELRQAQEERNSDLYRTSIQYTVLGNIHGKEVYLVPPQDAALLLKDRISPKLRKHLKQHNQ